MRPEFQLVLLRERMSALRHREAELLKELDARKVEKSRKLREAWTPQRRAAQKELIRQNVHARGAHAGPKPWSRRPRSAADREAIRAWWTPERRRAMSAVMLRAKARAKRVEPEGE